MAMRTAYWIIIVLDEAGLGVIFGDFMAVIV